MIALAVHSSGVTALMLDHWCNECSGPRIGQAKRIEKIETQNSQLGCVVCDLTIDNHYPAGGYPGKTLSLSRNPLRLITRGSGPASVRGVTKTSSIVIRGNIIAPSC